MRQINISLGPGQIKTPIKCVMLLKPYLRIEVTGRKKQYVLVEYHILQTYFIDKQLAIWHDT